MDNFVFVYKTLPFLKDDRQNFTFILSIFSKFKALEQLGVHFSFMSLFLSFLNSHNFISTGGHRKTAKAKDTSLVTKDGPGVECR